MNCRSLWWPKHHPKAMQPKAIGSTVLSPPTIHSSITMVRITDTRVVQIAHMASDLMESACLRFDLEQRATWFVGASEQFDGALCFFENPVVILHGPCDGDRRVRRVMATHKCDVCLLSFAERLLKRGCPRPCFGKQQAARCLKVESVDRIDASPDLVANPL